jgi:Flp pilus assembly protein TadB
MTAQFSAAGPNGKVRGRQATTLANRRAALTLGSGALAAGWALGSPALASGVPLLLVCVWHWRRSQAEAAARQATDTETMTLVAALIQRLKGGRSLAQALAEVTESAASTQGALGPVLVRLRAALAAGTGVERALGHAAGWAPPTTWLPPPRGPWAGLRRAVDAGSAQPRRGDGRARRHIDRPPPLQGDAGLGLTLLTLMVLVQRGGPALPALERLDDTLRSVEWVQAETRVQASQATASALALAGLPALFVVALAALDHGLARFYGFEALGAFCLVGSGLLSYAGWWWMHRIVAKMLAMP